MPETATRHDDEINLFELFVTLWKGKWLILTAMFGAIILGMLYSVSLPNSYSGTTFVRAAQPSAFTRYAFLSEIIGKNDFSYKISREFIFNAFISEFNDLEEVIKTLRSDEFVVQKLSEVEAEKQANVLISLAKQFQIILPQQNEKNPELRFKWHDPETGKQLFETSLQLVLANVKATLAKDIDQYALGAQSKLNIKIENAVLKKEIIKEGIRLADKQRLLFLTEQATIARELGVASNFLEGNEQLNMSASGVSLSVQSSSRPFYMHGYIAIEKEIASIQARSREDRLALSKEYAKVEQEIYGLKNDASVARLLAAQQMINIDDPGRWVLFNLNLAEITPNKKTNLTLALSAVLGAMIGAFFALMRSAFRKRKATHDV
ncbi:Wzz/FepE/Etk N-terminal domain-containing protein [Rhodobacteraceae bacterium nBUS_22]